MRLHRFTFPLAAIIAAFTLAQAAHANVMIIIDKSAQTMTVTVNGDDRYIWPVSTGRAGYDTPLGDFQPFRMEKNHYSREWDDAPMPNSIFFTKEGHAIHGSYEVRNLGRPASHGCVRLAPQNAAILYALVKDEGVFNTRFPRLMISSRAAVMARHGAGTTCGTTVRTTASMRRRSAATRPATGVKRSTARALTIIVPIRTTTAATIITTAGFSVAHSGGESRGAKISHGA
jgi:L,D-transpeptidase-like protein